MPYNNELEDLEYEDPLKIFDEELDAKYKQQRDQNMLTKEHKELIKRRARANKLNGLLEDNSLDILDELYS